MNTRLRRINGTGIWVALVSLLVVSPVAAAESDPALFTAERNRTTRIGMSILGGWALTNMAVGAPLYFTSTGENRSFHEMNVMWNVVNSGIAAAGYLGSRAPEHELTLSEALEAQRSIESALLLNMGLDVAYMAAGWALLERSNRTVPDATRWAGYGRALLLQGGFLFAFDLGLYVFQIRNRPEL